MDEQQLSQLSLEEKMKVTQFLIADLAANILTQDAAVVDKTRHDLGALAMTFTNLHQLILAAPENSLTTVKSIYSRFRYEEPAATV
jgi:hypothetical protein